MAHDMQHALDATEDIVAAYSVSNLRLWYPRFSLAWLGARPSTFVLDERGIFLDEEIPDLASRMSREETNQGIAEHYSASEPLTHSLVTKTAKPKGNPLTPLWYYSLARRVWNHRRTMRARLSLSNSIRSIEHSPHLRHAFKNAAGVAILSIPAFLPTTSSGIYTVFVFLCFVFNTFFGISAPQWFKSHYGPWMLISYVWVLETNTGATVGARHSCSGRAFIHRSCSGVWHTCA
jgi:hypothetical protein